MKGQNFLKRLKYAVDGISVAFFREKSFRFHLLAGIGVLLTLWITESSTMWWALSIVTIGLVIIAELFNSALETLMDHIHPHQHKEIGVAKDIAAGGVLIAALVAIVVAVAFIFDKIHR